MDLSKALQELYAEKERLEHSITLLEELEKKTSREPPPAGRRRGRKGMSNEERLQVSTRMRTYWASRRHQGSSSSSI
jgi:hypothetical protein